MKPYGKPRGLCECFDCGELPKTKSLKKRARRMVDAEIGEQMSELEVELEEDEEGEE